MDRVLFGIAGAAVAYWLLTQYADELALITNGGGDQTENGDTGNAGTVTQSPPFNPNTAPIIYPSESQPLPPITQTTPLPSQQAPLPVTPLPHSGGGTIDGGSSSGQSYIEPPNRNPLCEIAGGDLMLRMEFGCDANGGYNQPYMW